MTTNKSLLVLLLILCAVAPVRGQIYRVDGSLFPGTEGIKLGPGVDLSGWDLGALKRNEVGAILPSRGANLAGLDLTGANFSRANLMAADLTNTNLTKANLSHTNLWGDFHGTILKEADLSDSDLSKSTLTDTDLTNADLTGADFSGAWIERANLTGAEFGRVGSVIMWFFNSKFANADLSQATNLSNVYFFESNYNQWTRFPPSFQPDPAEFSLVRSPAGDFDANDQLDIEDLNLLSIVLRGGDPPGAAPLAMFNVSGETGAPIDQADLRKWITELKLTWFGDADLNGEFNSGDLVLVFQAGQYEDGIEGNSTWTTGDWDLDGDFTTSDLVAAFQDGGFEAGRRPPVAAVPEPNMFLASMVGVLAIAMLRRNSIGLDR